MRFTFVLISLYSSLAWSQYAGLRILEQTDPMNMSSLKTNAFLGHPSDDQMQAIANRGEWKAAFQGKFAKGQLYNSVASLGLKTGVWPTPRYQRQMTVSQNPNQMATGIQLRTLPDNTDEVGYFLHTRTAEALLRSSRGERRNVPMALEYRFAEPKVIFRSKDSFAEMKLKVKVPYFHKETSEGIGLLGAWLQFRHKDWLSDKCGYRKYDVIWIGVKIFDSRGKNLNRSVVHTDKGYSDNLKQVCNGKSHPNPKAIIKTKLLNGYSKYATVHNGSFKTKAFSYQNIHITMDHKQFVEAIKEFNKLLERDLPNDDNKQLRKYSEVPSDYVLENVHLNGEIPYKDGHHVQMGVGVRDFEMTSYY